MAGCGSQLQFNDLVRFHGIHFETCLPFRLTNSTSFARTILILKRKSSMSREQPQSQANGDRDSWTPYFTL